MPFSDLAITSLVVLALILLGACNRDAPELPTIGVIVFEPDVIVMDDSDKDSGIHVPGSGH